MKIIAVYISLCLSALLVFSGCGSDNVAGTWVPVENMQERELKNFIADHVATIRPLEEKYNSLYWDASTTGEQEYYTQIAEVELKMKQLYQNPEDFAIIKKLKKSGKITPPVLKRQLDKLYLAYLPNQIDTELAKQIVELNSKTQNTYNNYRGSIDGQEVTMSEIYTIMTTSNDTAQREKAWLASKEVGNVIIEDLLKLVKLRNKAAKSVGFDNYHTLMMYTTEQSVEELDTIFNELYELTNEPFAQMKAELDSILAKQYGIETSALRPWHYHDPFFQRTPLVYELNLDDYYAKADVKKLAQKYYTSVDLSVDDILAASDLYDRENKYPHAFSHSMDRNGNARVLANLQNTERWMETLLHELGHAVYSKYHSLDEPYLLREPAHSFTTEAVAMFFGRLSRNASWMQKMMKLNKKEYKQIDKVSKKYLQFQQILFARWAMVMYNFEKELYANPDQDLNTLWWDMVEKYQLANRPDSKPDAGWASKLHFVTAPCYYHNYMLGELLASQWHNYILTNVLNEEADANVSFCGNKRIGKYFKEQVLGPGAKYSWNEMIKHSTENYLNPKYFVEQFVK